ncbi:hypothetical protein ACH5RR_025837 [Cinchona calisaya]|uniref:Reverse transcriptase/retrotransposon-derived protein RNase H-like domain-containing protein n=1 Tax=Cinchona calisaya TaxID=153742 RepID=A0ABD2Z459_9GENT
MDSLLSSVDMKFSSILKMLAKENGALEEGQENCARLPCYQPPTISKSYQWMVNNKFWVEKSAEDGFHWSEVATQAFQTLKIAITTALVLRLLDFQKSFIIETDASISGIGSVLMQEGHHIAYLSKSLCDKIKGQSIYEKELLASVLVVTKWKHYLLGHHFVIQNNHQSLKYLLEQKLTSSLQHKWLTKLLGLDCEIHYKMGAENKVTNTFSRRTEVEEVESSDSALVAISSLQPAWMQEIIQSSEEDPDYLQLLTQFTIDPIAIPFFQFVNVILKYSGKIYVGKSTQLKENSFSQSMIQL